MPDVLRWRPRAGCPRKIGRMPCLGEVVPFEGEDDEQLVHVFADRLHPPFAPGPDFRGDVVEDADAVLLGPASHLHIEARIIHQDQHVGGERLDVLPALFHLAADRPQVFDYFDDAEKRGFLVMFGQIPAASDPAILSPPQKRNFASGSWAFSLSSGWRRAGRPKARRLSGSNAYRKSYSSFSKSGRSRLVRSQACSSFQRSIRAKLPERSTSGTFQPLNSAGRV